MVPRTHPLSRGRFWPYLANDPDQIQQAGVIISSPLGRMVQGQKICRRVFGISVRGRSYRAPNLTNAATFLDFRDFRRCLACHSSAANYPIPIIFQNSIVGMGLYKITKLQICRLETDVTSNGQTFGKVQSRTIATRGDV